MGGKQPIMDRNVASREHTLVGIGGTVQLPSESCNFLRDAVDFVAEGDFPVPFRVAALEVVRDFTDLCSAPGKRVRLDLRSALPRPALPMYCTTDIRSAPSRARAGRRASDLPARPHAAKF